MPIKEVQITNKQHAVPQNIMDVEFKLIGDLTMRQFAYLVVFGGLAWASLSLVQGVFRVPFTLFFAVFGLGLAFFTIGDRGMDQWVVNFFRSMYTPTQKIWKKDPIVPSIFLYQSLAVVRQEIITLAPTSSRRKLEEYLEYQGDTYKSDRLDIPEMEYIKMVRDAYSGDNQPVQNVQPAYQSVSTVVAPPDVSVVVDRTVSAGVSTPLQPEPEKRAYEDKKVGVPAETKAGQQQLVTTPQKQVEETKVQKTQKIAKPRTGLPKFNIPSRKEAYIPLTPITPDMHSGRVFTNLLPEQSEIILPVRGEKILKTSEEQDIEQDISQKAEQLRKLIEQIKKDETFKGIVQNQAKVQPQTPPSTMPQTPSNQPTQSTQPAVIADTKQSIQLPIAQSPQVEVVAKVHDITLGNQPSQEPVVPEVKEVKEAGSILESLRSENTFLNKEIERMRAEIDKARQQGLDEGQKKTELEKLQKEKAQVTGEVQTLQSTISDIQEKIQQKQLITSPTYAKIQPLTDRANIISGVVKNINTNVALEGIVLIIKNQKGESVRALKTNALGQFSISTPLSNGGYTIEIDSSNKTGLTFDIISVELKGVVLPPIEFLGR